MLALVCGGAGLPFYCITVGYIGSHLVREISKDPKYKIIVFDNLSTGHKELIPASAEFIQGDIRSKIDLEKAFSVHKIDVVFHFCASIEVAESVANPLKYYENNVAGTITLLQIMQKYNTKVNFIVFILAIVLRLFLNSCLVWTAREVIH